jgi:acyl-CoA synthetase (AMP-forming)/AMP-acid ligase II
MTLAKTGILLPYLLEQWFRGGSLTATAGRMWPWPQKRQAQKPSRRQPLALAYTLGCFSPPSSVMITHTVIPCVGSFHSVHPGALLSTCQAACWVTWGIMLYFSGSVSFILKNILGDSPSLEKIKTRIVSVTCEDLMARWQNQNFHRALVAHAYNPSYSGGLQ